MADVIGTPALRAEFDGRGLVQGAQQAGAKLKTTFEQSNRTVEKVQRDATRRIQTLISSINAEKPRRQMFELSQAVQHLGGTANLTEQQLAKVRREVERLTAAGARAPKSLAGLVPSAGGAGAALKDAQSQITGALAGQAGGLGSVLGAVGPAGLAAAAGIGAVTGAAVMAARAVGDLAERGSRLSDLSAKTQIGVESLQRMEYAGSLVGVSIDTITNASLRLDRALIDTPEKFARLGLSAEQLLDLNPEQRFEALAGALQALPEGPQRTAAMFDLLGRSAGEVLPYLSTNLAEAHAEAERLGIVLDEETVKAADALDDAMTRLGKSAEAFKLQLAALLLGGGEASDALDLLAESVGSVARFVKENRSEFELLAKLLVGGGTFFGMDIRRDLQTQYGERGAAPEVKDKRTGSIFGPQGLQAPSGPTSAELERERQVDREREESTRRAIEAEKQLAAERAKAATRATEAAVAAERESLELRQKLVQGALAGVGGTSTGGGIPTLGGLGDPAKAAQAQYEQAIKLAQAAQASGLSLEQIRSKLEGMGLSSDEAAGILEKHLKAQEEVKESTRDWSGQLADLANLMQGMGGVAGKFGSVLAGVASSISGLGSFLGRLKSGEGGGIGKSLTGFLDKLGLGKIGSALGKVVPFAGAALSVVSLGKSLFGGLKSLFGGKSKEQKEAERQAKEEAAKAKAEAEKQARITARQNLEQGLGTARTAAESLMARLAQGGLSEGLTKALQSIIGKVGDALLRTGLGILDGRLQESQAFTDTQKTASDIASVIQGMRQAGLIDEGLLGAAGAAAGEVKQQAIDAALAAGLSPEEAARAGSAAIAPLLREQLNASLQSGKELDANTKALLEEAKKNGIEILADPAIETLDVAKQQLDVLKQLAGSKTGLPTTSAARGVGPFVSKTEGLIHYHPNELIWVLPKNMQPGGMISAARGLYRDDEDRPLPRERNGEPGEQGEPQDTSTPAALAESVGAQVAAAILPALRQAVVSAAPINIAPQIMVNEDPEGDKETRVARRRQTVATVADAFRRREPSLMIEARRALAER